MKVIILQTSDGYEGFYFDGKLFEEGSSPLGEGDRLYLLKLAEELKLKSDDIKIEDLTMFDDKIVLENGSFPLLITDFRDSDYYLS